MNKTTGKSGERLKLSDLICMPSCKVCSTRRGGGGGDDCVEIKEDFKNGYVTDTQTMIP